MSLLNSIPFHTIYDAFGTLQFSSATYSVTEGTPNASITISRTGGNDQAVSVNCSTVAGGSAIGGGTDYTTVTNHLISFADQDSADKTCLIPITNDMIFEVAETVNLSLSGAVGAPIGLTPISFVNNPLFSETNDTLGNVLSVYPNNFITGNVNVLEPLATNDSVGGTVVDAAGKELVNTTVVLTALDGTIQTAKANKSGRFIFTEVPVGETYIISVRSKIYRFSPQAVNVLDNINDLLLTPEP